VERLARSYGSEPIARTADHDQLPLEGRALKSATWRVFAFHLLRVALFFGAAYNYYSHNDGTAWLLGILFVYSYLDREFFLKPNLMNAYLAFSVIYYYSRWVMGWGNPYTTIYGQDAPNWVKVIKDIVWVGFVVVFAFRALTRPRFGRNMPLWFTPRGMILVLLTVVYLVLPTLALIYARGNIFDIVLLAMRYPLEYVPFVFLFPFILRGESSIRYLRTFIPLASLSLMFLGIEMFSGRRTGMGYGGMYTRYGSIFGSPNDFGVFMMLAIATALAFLAERAIRWTPKVVAFLILCLCGLAATISLSANLAMVFTTINLVLFTKDRIKSVMTVIAVAILAACLYYVFPDVGVAKFLVVRIENLATFRDESATSHYTSVILAEDAINRFEPAEYVFGTFDSRNQALAPETYYLRTFYLRGGASLVILLAIIGLSLFESHHRYRAAKGDRERRGLFLACFLGVAGVAFACLFIPYLDSFPSNFYFWFLVAIIWCEPMSEREIVAMHAARPQQHVVGGKSGKLAPGLARL
jgi:hypothetical protein